MIIEKEKGGVGRGKKKQAELGCVCESVSMRVCVSMCVVHPHRATELSCQPPPGQGRADLGACGSPGVSALCCTRC